MWTKDYLVRGLVKRRRGERERLFWYEKRSWLNGDAVWTAQDEWQALYRVEHARRQLKAARKEAEEQRLAILAWDVDVLRDKIMEAAKAAAQRTRDAAAKPEPPRPECRRPRERDKRAEVLPELRWVAEVGITGQREIGRRRHAWAWARRQEGWTLEAIGRGLGVGPERVRQMLSTEVGRRHSRAKSMWSWYSTRTNLGRPLDMGGPRDRWLEYKPEDAL